MLLRRLVKQKSIIRHVTDSFRFCKSVVKRVSSDFDLKYETSTTRTYAGSASGLNVLLYAILNSTFTVNYLVLRSRVQKNSMGVYNDAGSGSWLKAELGRRVARYWRRLPEPEALGTPLEMLMPSECFLTVEL